MGTNLHWKKGIFKSAFEIFSGEINVGRIKDDSWRQSGFGELNGKKYLFKTKGFFNKETEIIDSRNNVTIGKITYNSWKTKANIEYDKGTIDWKYDNGWNTKWSVSDNRGTILKYHGSLTKGEIEINVQDELLILSGLYISNYFWQISSVVILGVYLPVFITAF
jgi:hypothetical protein